MIKQIAILGALIFPGFGVGDVEASSPNVVFVLADDLGWGDISCNGGEIPTPHIDRLMKQGVRLNNFLVNPVCSPTRAAFLTGRNPLVINQAPSVDGVLDPALPTVARDFQSAGYATGAFGKWHNSAPPKFAHLKNEPVFHVNEYGFDRFVGFYGGGVDFYTKIWPNTTDSPAWYHDREAVDDEPGYTGELITKHALEFIKRNRAAPFFCYVAQELVHTPLHPSENVLGRIPESFYAASGGRRSVEEYYQLGCKSYGPTGERFIEAHNRLKGTDYDWKTIPNPDDAMERLLYAAMVISLDGCIGEITACLDREGLSENTILLFASDNGATPRGNNQPFRGHKHTLWEGGIHVPAAIRWPQGGLTAARYRADTPSASYDGLMRITDLYPTLASVCGVPVTGKQLEGTDLSDALVENRPLQRDGFHYLWRANEVWRGERWKLFRHADRSRNQLFDLQNDPHEKNDVLERYPEVAKELCARMDAYAARNGIRPATIPVADAGVARPQGDVLSVVYAGTAPAKKPNSLFVFGKRIERGDQANTKTSDLLVYDLYVKPGSANNGFHLGFKSWNLAYYYDHGVAPDGRVFRDVEYKVGEWQRIKVGMADFAPLPQSPVQFFIHPELAGSVDVLIDNVHVERADGTRLVYWEQGGPRTTKTDAVVSVLRSEPQ